MQQLLANTYSLESLLDSKQLNTEMDVVYMTSRRLLSLITSYCDKTGIHRSLLSWFQYYLISRRQCVWVEDSHSQFCDVISEVPQGNILGPLFLSYMSMICLIPCTMPSPSYMFADDTKCAITTDCSLEINPLQSTLVNLRIYLELHLESTI